MTATRAENVPPGVWAIHGGEVLRLTRAASPQFVVPVVVRVIRLCDFRSPPPYGWEWIDAYQLNRSGDAVARRELFVLLEGVTRLTDPLGPPLARRRTPARVGA
ncbi:hypothetical protein O7622_02045 [Micromonospora sp. WMMD1076]|uniref:hypothetical protein n=1 Tax=Micromonospora TaxID=1873 RepID=UPI00249CBD89|nr:hypothetical protein [Micromonospora sp. WMMD1076]WFF07406.1 hypothetical protein O7622_02045 [Micromonospora sp. WMMD1076]